MKPSETIGQRIRQVRGDLSQKAFGARVGLSQTGVTALENDKSAPRLSTLSRIADSFKVSFDWLHTGVGSMKGANTAQATVTTEALPVAAEPAAPYAPACLAPTTVVPLSRQLAEAHARILELEAELKDERKQARQDLRLQATHYNSVKEEQSQLITRLYAKIDEYELRLGFRQPTAAERALMGGGEPRMEVKPFGERYRTELPTARKQATECVVRKMYPAAEVSHYEAA